MAVAWSAEALCVDGEGRRPGEPLLRSSAGHGLLGMSERVAIFGGVVEAGPLPGKGWRVSRAAPVACSHLVTIRVLIADDQPLMRTGFRMILHATDDVRVVGEASDGAAAAIGAAELQPDVVLMDIRMPGTDGIEGTRRIVAEVSPSHAS